jgi:DNA-binding NarL/FixJ family response regulator
VTKVTISAYGRAHADRHPVADDHPLFRQGLRRLLDTVREFRVVAEVERGDEVLEAVRAHAPEVVVLDVELPGSSGIAAVEAIRAAAPDIRIVMLSGFGDAKRVRAALRAGAHGYVLKNAPPAEILDAIRTVAGGRTVLPPIVAESVVESLRQEPEEEAFRRSVATLSDRELEVLKLAASGESNAAIGKRLFISEGTVKNHMTHILRKLGVEDRTQAAILAVKHGLS